MKYYLEKFGYKTSKSAVERRAILKRINKKYGFEHLLELITRKVKKTPKSKINEIMILRSDLDWIKNYKGKS